MRQLPAALAAAAAVGVLVSTAVAQPAYGILPQAPDSRERQAPIDGLRAQGAALAHAFAPRAYANARGERMPYRLFAPARLEPGRRYPLVVFLHGSGGGALPCWACPAMAAAEAAAAASAATTRASRPAVLLADMLPPPGSRRMRRARGSGGSSGR